MYKYSILPTNFQENRRGWNPPRPPPPSLRYQKSVVLRGTTCTISFSPTTTSPTSTPCRRLESVVKVDISVSFSLYVYCNFHILFFLCYCNLYFYQFRHNMHIRYWVSLKIFWEIYAIFFYRRCRPSSSRATTSATSPIWSIYRQSCGSGLRFTESGSRKKQDLTN